MGLLDTINSSLGTSITGGDVLGALGNLGGYYAASQAAQNQANALNNLGAQAASMSEFKPYSVTSGYGTGYFDTSKQQAGYALNPVLEAFRNQFYGGAGNVLGQINLDPTKAAQQYVTQQQALLQPTRQAEDIALRNQQLNRGRIGLGVSGTAMGAGGAGMVNPEQYQRDLARARADQELATRAQEYGQADIDRLIGRGQGLFQFGAGIEELGLKPLTLGADLGKAVSTAGAQGAQSLLGAGQAAANANLFAGLQQANAIGGLGGALGGMFGRRG
jgi:hypothetical protein